MSYHSWLCPIQKNYIGFCCYFFKVIIAVTTTKSMQSVTNIFIVNLATADLLVMLFCAPPSVIWDVTNTWIFGSLMCRIIGYIQVIQIIYKNVYEI